LVEDYLYIYWRLSLYCWRLLVYWLEIIYILAGDYLYIGWILSVYWLGIICILVDYLCIDWTSVILYSVCSTNQNCCCAQIVGCVTSVVVAKCGAQLII